MSVIKPSEPHTHACSGLSDYNKTSHDGLGIDAATLEGSTKIQVQDHNPKAHTHVESEITDLSHDAQKIKGKTIDDSAIGDGKTLTYKSASGKIEYETPGGAALPAGIIVMWSGLIANIPSGWALCDGQGGRPDLRSKFIMGAPQGEEARGTGGNLTLSHSGVAVQDHAALSHAGCAVADHPAHTHGTQPLTTGSTSGAQKKGTTTATITEAHTHTITIPDSAVQTHSVTQPSDHPIQSHTVTQPDDHSDIRPPYYTLAFIIKL